MVGSSRWVAILFFLCGWACVRDAGSESPGLPLAAIRLPAGFEITVFATGVENARQMAMSPKGVVYVGSLRPGKVHAVVDRDRDGKADSVTVVARDLFLPSGVAWRDGALYVAEVNRILRYDGIDDRLEAPPEPKVVFDGLPDDTHHGWKFIAFGPDGRLYVPVGAPCNVCPLRDPFGTILAMNPDGSELEVFARGVRNSVGFDWNPETKALWFTDNGRDWLGDDAPPDELNRAEKAGLHFGFPWCHGGDLSDPQFGSERACGDFTPPARKLGPHVAAIGMRFYTGRSFPEEYRGRILVAEHGSWNRSEPIGYRVMQVAVEDGKAVSYEPFAEGWLRNGKAWGRPADVLVLPDGSVLVSDDQANVIYRIAHRG